MRVLYVVPEIALPGTHGGAAHVMSKLVSFKRLKHEVILICKKSSGQRWYEKEPLRTTIRLPVPSFSLLKVFCYFLFSFVICLYYLCKGKVDIVYERGRIYGGTGVLAAWLCKVKSIYEINEPYYEVPVLLGKKSKKSLFFKTTRFWHFVIINKATLLTITYDSLIKHGVVPKEKTYITSTGVDTRLFAPSPSPITKKYNLTNKFVVLYTGSFAPWHACENIIKVAQYIAKQHKNIIFILAGEGKSLPQYKKLVTDLKLTDTIIFPGKVPHNKVPQYVNAADVCLALFDRTYPPFKKYSFYYYPVKLNEYKACGKPIIASNFGNLAKVIKPKINGLLVNERNTKDVANAIITLAKNDSLCKKIGKNNRKEAVELYDWDKETTTILNAVKKI